MEICSIGNQVLLNVPSKYTSEKKPNSGKRTEAKIQLPKGNLKTVILNHKLRESPITSVFSFLILKIWKFSFIVKSWSYIFSADWENRYMKWEWGKGYFRKILLLYIFNIQVRKENRISNFNITIIEKIKDRKSGVWRKKKWKKFGGIQ